MESIVLVQSLGDTSFPIVKEGIPSYLGDVKYDIPSTRSLGQAQDGPKRCQNARIKMQNDKSKKKCRARLVLAVRLRQVSQPRAGAALHDLERSHCPDGSAVAMTWELRAPVKNADQTKYNNRSQNLWK
jgi:hypothetical protein